MGGDVDFLLYLSNREILWPWVHQTFSHLLYVTHERVNRAHLSLLPLPTSSPHPLSCAIPILSQLHRCCCPSHSACPSPRAAQQPSTQPQALCGSLRWAGGAGSAVPCSRAAVGQQDSCGAVGLHGCAGAFCPSELPTEEKAWEAR